MVFDKIRHGLFDVTIYGVAWHMCEKEELGGRVIPQICVNRIFKGICSTEPVLYVTQEEAEIGRFMDVAEKNVKANMDLVRMWGADGPIERPGNCACIRSRSPVRLVYDHVPPDLSLGDFVAFTSYLSMLVWPMIALGWVVNVMERGFAAPRQA